MADQTQDSAEQARIDMWDRLQRRHATPHKTATLVLDDLHKEAKNAGFADILAAIQIARRDDRQRRFDIR